MDYSLCSQAAIDHLQPAEVSTPFRSGYDHDTDLYYVALIDTKAAVRYYDKVIEPFNKKAKIHIDFWFRECSSGSMDVDEFDKEGLRRNGLFKEIENVIGLTTESNRAMTICNLADDFGLTPVELIDQIVNDLTPDEAKLQAEFKAMLDKFGTVLLDKLLANERKYQFGNAWKIPDWKEHLQQGLVDHTKKGDPRDVAIYALFAWHHGWPTAE
jgi:hypothetical protein